MSLLQLDRAILIVASAAPYVASASWAQRHVYMCVIGLLIVSPHESETPDPQPFDSESNAPGLRRICENVK